MNTFLPYDNFNDSARALDHVRLNNQRNEAMVIIKTLLDMYPITKTGRRGGWPYHPATKMWQGFEYALRNYALAICKECNRRRITDRKNVESFFRELDIPAGYLGDPHWLGGRIHATHRASLLLKYPEWYGKFGWKEKPVEDYFWPKGKS